VADVAAGGDAPHLDTDNWRRYTLGDGVAVGVILPFAGNGAIPSGYLLCDGAAYSRTAFPDLFACIGTDYGAGDGSTTFNVPDANQAKRFLQGDTVAGQTKDAGLPNITGGISGSSVYNNALPVNPAGYFDGASGAFAANTGGAAIQSGGGMITAYNNLSFDASRSNSIYGNSTTVQPPALTTRYIIKAFDGQTADSALIDITQYENELGGKADRSLSNLTDAGKSFSFPSDTYVNIPNVTNGMTYTAPADGYIYLCGQATTLPAFVGLNRADNTDGGTTCWIGTNSTKGRVYVPIRKGESYIFGILNVTVTLARFYYAQGEVPA
jgi:microcystin-dependent protein